MVRKINDSRPFCLANHVTHAMTSMSLNKTFANNSQVVQYLIIHVQFSIAGQSSQSLTDCLLVPVCWHHVEAEVELINRQIIVPCMILQHSYRPEGRGGQRSEARGNTHFNMFFCKF